MTKKLNKVNRLRRNMR